MHINPHITGKAQKEQGELQDDVLAGVCERSQPAHLAERADEEDKDGALQNGEQ